MDAFRVLRFASDGKWSGAEEFWHRAKPSRVPEGSRPHWMRFGDKWVEELRCAVEVSTIYLAQAHAGS